MEEQIWDLKIAVKGWLGVEFSWKVFPQILQMIVHKNKSQLMAEVNRKYCFVLRTNFAHKFAVCTGRQKYLPGGRISVYSS